MLSEKQIGWSLDCDADSGQRVIIDAEGHPIAELSPHATVEQVALLIHSAECLSACRFASECFGYLEQFLGSFVPEVVRCKNIINGVIAKAEGR